MTHVPDSPPLLHLRAMLLRRQPVYYADIVCERALHYLNAILSPKIKDARDAQITGADEEERQRQLAEVKRRTMARAKEIWGGGIHRNMQDRMFYL